MAGCNTTLQEVVEYTDDGAIEMVRLHEWLRAGGSPDEADSDGGSALHLAAKGDHAEAARLLLDHGATVDRRSRDGWTPLHLAAYLHHLAVAEVLLAHGASPHRTTDDGQTPLQVAAQNRQMVPHVWSWDVPMSELMAMLRVLLQHGADPRRRDPIGYTPLHCVLQRLFVYHHRRVGQEMAR